MSTRTWQNGNNKVFYQPVDASGHGAYLDSVNNRYWDTAMLGHRDGPRLFRSKARAERVARRRNAHIAKTTVTLVEEAALDAGGRIAS